MMLRMFTAPFRLSPLKCGRSVLEGLWYEIVDSNDNLVCKIPVEQQKRESDGQYASRVEVHTEEILLLLNNAAPKSAPQSEQKNT